MSSKCQRKNNKHCSAAQRGTGNKERVTCSLIYMDDAYSIEMCTKEEQLCFVRKLVELSKMTWQEVIFSQRHGLGSEKIDPNAIKASTTKIPEDVTFIAIRFSGKKPMVGFRERNVFHIIWFDRDFTLYDH